MKALFKAKVHSLQSAQEAYLGLQQTNLSTAAISANDAIQALNNLSQSVLALMAPAASMLALPVRPTRLSLRQLLWAPAPGSPVQPRSF